MIVHLNIKIKKKCSRCGGTGEIIKNKKHYSTNQNKFFTYVCNNCDGDGWVWKKRTITSKQLKGILDEKD